MAPGRSWPVHPHRDQLDSRRRWRARGRCDLVPDSIDARVVYSHVGLLMEAKWKPHRTNRPVTGPSASRVSGSCHTRIERQASYIAWAWARVYVGPLESVQMSPPSALLRT